MKNMYEDPGCSKCCNGIDYYDIGMGFKHALRCSCTRISTKDYKQLLSIESDVTPREFNKMKSEFVDNNSNCGSDEMWSDDRSW